MQHRFGPTAIIRATVTALSNVWVFSIIVIIGILAGYYLEMADSIWLLLWDQPPPPPIDPPR